MSEFTQHPACRECPDARMCYGMIIATGKCGEINGYGNHLTPEERQAADYDWNWRPPVPVKTEGSTPRQQPLAPPPPPPPSPPPPPPAIMPERVLPGGLKRLDFEGAPPVPQPRAKTQVPSPGLKPSLKRLEMDKPATAVPQQVSPAVDPTYPSDWGSDSEGGNWLNRNRKGCGQWFEWLYHDSPNTSPPLYGHPSLSARFAAEEEFAQAQHSPKEWFENERARWRIRFDAKLQEEAETAKAQALERGLGRSPRGIPGHPRHGDIRPHGTSHTGDAVWSEFIVSQRNPQGIWISRGGRCGHGCTEPCMHD